jgi:hypothetical protein
LDEADESATGSANLWSGPRKRAGRLSWTRPERCLVPRWMRRDDQRMEIGPFSDETLILELRDTTSAYGDDEEECPQEDT